MRATFIQAGRFRSWWRDYALDDEDLRGLEMSILQNPLAGAVMRDCGGLRKIRFSPVRYGGGKSGGFRVCYAWLPEFGVVYLVLVFAKNVQSNLTADQKAASRKMIQGMRMALKLQRGER